MGNIPSRQWEISPLPAPLNAWDNSHMRSPVADEVERRMKALGMNPKHLSKAAGLNETYVRDLLEGKAKSPRADNLGKLADALGCTITDLQPPKVRMGQEARSAEPDLPSEPLGAATAIAEVGVYVGMGGGGVLDLEPINGTWQLPTEWLRQEIRGDLHQLRFLTVEGDSMAPTLDPGDKVIVDMNRRIPSPSGLFVLHDGMALVAKRLEPIGGTSPQRVRVISDNPRYQTEERLAEEIHIVGRIMARWERVG